MAWISPTTLDCRNSPHVSGKTNNHCRLTITNISQTGGAENKTTVDWKITVEGTPYTWLYALRVELGGVELYDHHTGGAILQSWSAGQVIKSGSTTFNNNSDGSLVLYAYIKQMFYYGNGDTSRWWNSNFYQDNSCNMTCSTIPRYTTVTQNTRETGDNYIMVNWYTSDPRDWTQYSINGGVWTDAGDVVASGSKSGYYTLNGLSPNTRYTIKTRCRRTDSGLWSETSVMEVTTLNSPYITAMSDFNIGSSFSCNIYNPKGRELKLYLYANNVADVIVRTITTNGTYTYYTDDNENTALYNTIPNSKYGLYRIAVVCPSLGTTNWSNNNVTDKTYYTVEQTCLPSVSAVIIDDNITSLALTGDNSKFIKYVSNANVVISSSANKGASIVSNRVVCGDGQSADGNTTFQNVESALFTVTTIDSRGYSVSQSYQKTLISYIKLTLNADVYRTSPTTGKIALKYNGNYFNDTFGLVVNTLNLKYRWHEIGVGTWSEWITLSPVKNGNAYTNGSAPIILGTDFDYQKSYMFEFEATDKIFDDGSVSSSKTVAVGLPIFDFGEDDFNINGILNLYEQNIMKQIANVLYPVNSIYLSLTQSIPNLLSGEWVYLNSIVYNGTTYYVYKKTNENEKLTLSGEDILYNSEEIYIENTLMKGSDVS